MRTVAMWRPAFRRPAAAVVAVLALGAACSSDPAPDPAPSGTDVPGASSLSATLTRYNSDIEPRRVQVQVQQGAGPAVALRGIEVRMAGFGDTSRPDLDTTSRPDGAIDLPVPFGEVRCDEDAGPVAVRIGVGDAAGTDTGTVDLEAADPSGLAKRVHDQECAVQELLTQAPVAWSEEWVRRESDGGPVVDGALRIGPVAAGRTVTLGVVDGTVLLTPSLRDGTTLPLDVGPGQTVEVPVTMAPARCDAHAVGEAKRGYSFEARAALDGAEPVLLTLLPTEPGRAVLQDMLLDGCGLR